MNSLENAIIIRSVMAASQRQEQRRRKCVGCNIYENKIRGACKIVETEEEKILFERTLTTSVSVGSSNRPLSQQSSEQLIFSSPPTQSSTQSSGDDPSVSYNVRPTRDGENEEMVTLPFGRTIRSNRYCCLCGSQDRLTVISFEARMQAFAQKQIVIPKYNRCCGHHLNAKKKIYEEDLETVRICTNTCEVQVSVVARLLESLSVRVDQGITNRVADFTLPEHRLKPLTGYNWEQIIELRDMMVSRRDRDKRTVNQALVTFLFKLRSGNSNAIVCAVLGLEREQQVSDHCNSIISAFVTDILPTRFGIHAANREDLIKNHTSSTAKELHDIDDDVLVLILDATYLKHQKSSNNFYQRKSYPGQKKASLAKFYTICTTTGHTVGVPGPSPADMNDATITKIIVNDKRYGFTDLLRKGDILIVDRGFRDVKELLEALGYRVFMPALKGKRKQLTVEESNWSRLVTILRWVVEAVHGIIGQKCKLLHHQFDNKLLPKAHALCQIASFLQNHFGKRIYSDNQDTKEVVQRMKERMNTKNELAEEVEAQGWSRKKVPFQVMSANELIDFPEMTELDLVKLVSGKYQLKQAISYLAEMMGEDDTFDLCYLKQTREILRVKVRSRHINSKTYNCYVHYAPNTVGCSGIKGHCCECANGLRTIGCCSHVSAIVYYLSHARYKARIVRPAQFSSKLFDPDVVTVIEEDSDED
ncbi:hypothetical protein QAD02_022659 [Eretmocerus hayati]|uniref:Uncharacterized protein n=1 Tax=Eretmocerus hayati TaxID=131215 RepID=A0ACC2PYH6_9HYME|nr:hypothetical protein QAD02_022659 [Eretmocerus hayati]